MRFPPEFLDELRARLPVSEVVGRRVKLKKAGREWKGLSPFNREKTPSFFANDQKAMWFDFSSGRNGNIFDFVMATEGVPSPRRSSALPPWRACRFPKPRRRRKRRPRTAARCTMSLNWRQGFSRRRWPPARSQGARLSRRPRHRSRHPTKIPARLCAARALRPQGAPGRSERLRRDHGGGGAAGGGRRRARPL